MPSYFMVKTLSWFLISLDFCKYIQILLINILNISQRHYIIIFLNHLFIIVETHISMPRFGLVTDTYAWEKVFYITTKN